MAEPINRALAEIAYNGLIAHIEARLHEGLPISPSDVLWLVNQLRERDLQLEHELQRLCEIIEGGPDRTMTAGDS